MTEPTFPTGYSRPPDGGPQGMGAMKTWPQMMQMKTVNYLHPEVQRRFHALILAGYNVGVPLGVGTGWRVQPNPPPQGFASPGNSWHESCPVSPSSPTALAIDTVPNISWEWMHTNCGAYGLRTFKYVGNEPWHVQPSEISTSRRYATKLPPLVVWQLPGSSPTPPPPTTGDDMATVIKGDRSDSYYAWNGVSISGIPSLEWAEWGVQAGLYPSATPTVYPQGFVDQLVAEQGER